MKLSRILTFFAVVVATAAFLQAEQPTSEPIRSTQPTFKEHRIGESAQEFFSIAKVAGKTGVLSTDYCLSYSNDPKIKKAIEKAGKKSVDADDPSLSSLLAAMTAEGCKKIQAALAGQNVEIDSLFAAEYGSGSVQFVAGHLASERFVVKATFNEVVEDMNSKLNAKPQLDVETVQNAVAAMIKQRSAMWTLPNTLVKVSELQSLEGEIVGTEVSVSETMNHRTNSLD